MDAETDYGGRVAYSFPPGTFDLQQSQASLCLASDDGATTYVGLRPHWPRLFESLRSLRVVLGAAAAGPMSLADTWEHPDFSRLPATKSLYDADTGVEVRLGKIASGIAVVDDHGTQQTASLQFFDRQGRGCLKVMLTNYTDLRAFDQLLERFAAPFDSGCENGPRPSPERDAEAGQLDETMALQLWRGAFRSRPDTWCPGADRLLRRALLEALPTEAAWLAEQQVVRRALELASQLHMPLTAMVNNTGATLPVVMTPQHWHPCAAGLTFFCPHAQLTLRPQREGWEAWATRSIVAPGTPLSLEVYDHEGNLCAVIAPTPHAGSQQVLAWNAVVKSHRAW